MVSHTEIHLIRHGETDWNALGRVQGQAESRLSELGKAQATALSMTVDPTAYDAVYCSSSVRTRQTLDGILAGRQCAVSYKDNLREIHLGPWQRLLRSEVDQRWPGEFEDFKNHPDRFALEGAETFKELQERGVNALRTISAEHAGKRVMVVSHGALIKAIYCASAGSDLSALWSKPDASNCARFVVNVDATGTLSNGAYFPGGTALVTTE